MIEIEIAQPADCEGCEDDIRLAFDELVRDLRATGAGVTGTLTLGEVVRSAEDVTDEPPTEAEDADDEGTEPTVDETAEEPADEPGEEGAP